MQIILIKDVDNLGGKDELVNVKNGYARNFLFPTKHAVEATSSNLKQLEERLKAKAKKEAVMLAEITKVISVCGPRRRPPAPVSESVRGQRLARGPL